MSVVFWLCVQDSASFLRIKPSCGSGVMLERRECVTAERWQVTLLLNRCNGVIIRLPTRLKLNKSTIFAATVEKGNLYYDTYIYSLSFCWPLGVASASYSIRTTGANQWYDYRRRYQRAGGLRQCRAPETRVAQLYQRSTNERRRQ